MLTKEKMNNKLNARMMRYNCLFCFNNQWNISEITPVDAQGRFRFKERFIQIRCENCGYVAHFSPEIME